jgi:hypothetical protein
MGNSTIQVSITEKKNDVFDVDILTHATMYSSFEYIIYGANNKMLRRGQFRAPSVQLRTTGMQEGNYLFQLLLNDNEILNVPFYKSNTNVAA